MNTLPPEDRWHVQSVPRTNPPQVDAIPPGDRWSWQGAASTDTRSISEVIEESYASFGKRFLAYVIDYVVIFLPVLLFASAVFGFGQETMIARTAVAAVVFFLYHFFAVRQEGQTFGYMALRLRVVNADDSPVSSRQAFIRALLKVGIPYVCNMFAAVLSLIGGLDSLWMLRDAHKQTWHDKAAGTYVIQE